MGKLDFRFALILAHKLLSLLSAADQALQSRRVGLKEAAGIVTSSIDEISKLRSEETFTLLFNEATNLLPSAANNDNNASDKKESRRSHHLWKHLL